MPETPAQTAARLNRASAGARATSVSGAGQQTDLSEVEAMSFAKAYGWGTVPKHDDPKKETFKAKLELWRKKGKPMPKVTLGDMAKKAK